MFIVISMNEWVFAGYLNSLAALFTERKVPSETRSLLVLCSLPLFLRLLVAPISDKYFLPALGKRKTYIVPTKLIAFVAYFVMAFYIESVVDRNMVPLIALVMALINTVMMWEFNALSAFKLDVFGQNVGAISAAQSIAYTLGGLTGYQVFTALNSPRICREYFGLRDSLMTHSTLFFGIAFWNFLSVGLLYFIKDTKKDHDGLVNLPPLRTLQLIFRSPIHRRIILWNIFGTCSVIGIKMTSFQYYIKKGIKRDSLVLSSILFAPFSVISNILVIKFMKSGNLMFKCWAVILISVSLEFLHVPNFLLFDPSSNYDRTFLTILIIGCLDSMTPWFGFSNSLITATSTHRYAASYLATSTSTLVFGRIGIILFMNSLVDYVSLPVMYSGIVLYQIVFAAFTLNTVREIDRIPMSTYRDTFDQMAEMNQLPEEAKPTNIAF